MCYCCMIQTLSILDLVWLFLCLAGHMHWIRDVAEATNAIVGIGGGRAAKTRSASGALGRDQATEVSALAPHEMSILTPSGCQN